LEVCLFTENIPIFIAHHDCLVKMSKFVYKNTCQTVTNSQSQTTKKQNAIDYYQSQLTIENN